jgi:hypothetical protein
MKQQAMNSHTCGAQGLAAMAVLGAVAHGIALLGPQYEAAIRSSLDAAASALEIMAMDPSQAGDRDTVDALRIVEALRAHMDLSLAEWPSTKQGWGHA